VKVEASVSEVAQVFKEIQEQPSEILEMVQVGYAESGRRISN